MVSSQQTERYDILPLLEIGKCEFMVLTSVVAPAIFRRGAGSSDEGAKIWFSRYYKCQKSPKKSLFFFRRGASMLRRGL